MGTGGTTPWMKGHQKSMGLRVQNESSKGGLMFQGPPRCPGVLPSSRDQLSSAICPIAQQASIKVLIALATMMDWKLNCFNGK